MVNQAVARMIATRAELQVRLDQLIKEMEQTRTEMERLEESLSMYRKYSDKPIPELEGLSIPSGVPSQVHKSVVRARVRGIWQVDFVPLVRPILPKYGRPMEFEELLDAIQQTGRHIGGNPEDRNLKAKLGRAKKEIKYISGSGYWPIDVPCPKVSYTPP